MSNRRLVTHPPVKGKGAAERRQCPPVAPIMPTFGNGWVYFVFLVGTAFAPAKVAGPDHRGANRILPRPVLAV